MRATLLCGALLGGSAGVVAAPQPKPKEEDPPPITKEHLAASASNLRRIAIACHEYHDAKDEMPGNITSKDGKPLLSWRVSILPYMGEEALYKQFKLDEPWDSEHNRKLVERMPKVFAPVRVKAEAGLTYYLGFVGPKALFDPKARPLTLAKISEQNGVSNTILAVETRVPAVWTKPDALPFDEKKALPALGGLFDGDFHILLCDGSVLFRKKTVPEDSLKKAIQPSNNVPFTLNDPDE